LSDAEIAPCLDHQPTKDTHGKPLPAVTGRHYNHAQRKNIEDKRRVLDRWALELQRVVGEPAEVHHADAAMRQAA
jgi:hypothetical protein